MWTRFMDMHSGGSSKERWEHIYIEAAEAEAKVIFYNRFGHNPDRVTCTCCGSDYSIESGEDLAQLTGFDRGLRCVDAKRDPETGLYDNDDPNVRYLEPSEEPPVGYDVSKFSRFNGEARTLTEYLTDDLVLAIRAAEISDNERSGDVPSQGYVWVD